MSRRTVRVSLAGTEVAVVLACDGATTTASLLDRLAGHLKRHLYIAIDPKGTTLTFQNQPLPKEQILVAHAGLGAAWAANGKRPPVLVATCPSHDTEGAQPPAPPRSRVVSPPALTPLTPASAAFPRSSASLRRRRVTEGGADGELTFERDGRVGGAGARKDGRLAAAAGAPAAATVPLRTYNVTFVFPAEGGHVELAVPGETAIVRMKQQLWQARAAQADAKPLGAIDKYCLKYLDPEQQPVELFDEDQTLSSVSILPKWLAAKQPITFTVEQKRAASSGDKILGIKIGSLIGFSLHTLDQKYDMEINSFRRKMVRVRRNAVRLREKLLYNLALAVETTECPPNIRKLLKRDKIEVIVHLPAKLLRTTSSGHDNVGSKRMVDYQATPDTFMQEIFPRMRMSLPENASPSDYIFKACGTAEYFAGNYKLIDFTYIRNALLKGSEIHLTLVLLSEALPDAIEQTVDQHKEDLEMVEDAFSHGSHAELTLHNRDADRVHLISLWDVSRRFRVKVVGCERVPVDAGDVVFVEAGILRSLCTLTRSYHGGQLLCPLERTEQVRWSTNPRWEEWLQFDILTANLPRAARLCITVYARRGAKKTGGADYSAGVQPIGWVNKLLMDYRGVLVSGPVGLYLWPRDRANPIGSCVSNPDADKVATSLMIEFEDFNHPAVYPTEPPAVDESTSAPLPHDQERYLERIVASDPLTKLDDNAKRLIWAHRFNWVQRPEALPKVILSANWAARDDVQAVHRLLPRWAPLTPEMALELLDANFGDEEVRAYAVARVDTLPDADVIDYMVQLVQVLKYEPYHDSALARMLLRRALRSRLVGHHFFWHLRAEMHQLDIQVRFALLLEAYLRGAPAHMETLQTQNTALSALYNAATTIKGVKSAERADVLAAELSKIKFPPSFQIALNPRWEASGLVLNKCKYMDSKKLPLWLVFQNSDPTGKPIYVMLKSGDDLRQDMLTLQLITIMDKLWQREGLDLKMTPYLCLSTGDAVGMIEIVLNSETVSNIQQAYGGSTAAFRDTPLADWIRNQNPKDEDYERAVETFTLSCAGYCVATYVLGIGDRHNDNIMLSKNGRLFHIDFGHFLGNIKRKFGIKRERAPFVLTPDFVYVMGTKTSARFQKFQDLCVKAYLILRRHSSMFINLFAMMLSTGIPELKSTEDIYYLRDALCLDKTEQEAAQEFRNLIFESLRLGWSTQLNWWIHNLAHAR